jgi:hypothetical protein
VGSAFIIFVPNIGVLLFLVIFLVPHGAGQVAHYLESIHDKSQTIQRKQNVFNKT